MKFSTAAAAVMAFATQAFAQTPGFDPIYSPADQEVVKAGSTFRITWSAPKDYLSGTISIHLIGGATQGTQVPLLDIAAGVANSANFYDWTVDASLGDAAVYGLVFKLESDPSVFQYSNPFHIDNSAAPKTSSSAAVTGSATTTVPVTTGVKTVTLSSSSTSSTPIVLTTSAPCNTTAPVTTTAHTIVSVGYNCTTTLTKATVPVVVSSTAVVKPTGSAVTTPPPAQVTSAGSRLGAGVFAAVAGLAIAALAL